MWPEIWIGISKAAEKKEKEEWAVERPKLDNARKLRGISFIDLEDGEFKETIKNARKTLGVLVEAALPCKMETRKRAWKLRETVASEDTNSHKKTKYVCIVEAHESTSKLLESALPRKYEDHIAERGFNSLTHCNLVHNIYSHASSDENSGCESCSGSKMGEARENSSVESG